MASSNDLPDYPRRLYEPGKAPFQNHSINHNCSFTNLGIVREYVGEQVWEALVQSSVGVILKLSTQEFVFSSLTVHHFLTNQLQTMKPHEIWSLIGDQPIRFSLHEFSHITGMNCSPFDEEDELDVSHTDFWGEMGVGTSVGPCWEELERVLSQCATWSFTKKRMVGLLCVLSIGIFGISKSSRIPLDAAKRVLDFEAFERYPWGRVACDSLINGIKVVVFQKDSYVVKGLVHVLQVWAYESVEVIGEKFGNVKDAMNDIPLLRWRGSRKRIKCPVIIEKEMEIHGKVRAHNIVPKPETEIYPQWDDDVEDPRVNNLIQDLLHHRYSSCFYRYVDMKKLGKRRTITQNSPCKKNKKGIEKGSSKSEKAPTRSEEGVSKVQMEDKICNDDSILSEVARAGFGKMLVEFGDKLNAMEINLGKKVLGLEESLEARMEANQAVRMEVFEARLEKVERLLEEINTRGQATEMKDVNPPTLKAANKAESSSKTPSYLVRNIQTSEDGFPFACAVKKKPQNKPMVTTNNEVTSSLRLVSRKVTAKVKKEPAVKKTLIAHSNSTGTSDLGKQKKIKSLTNFLDGLLFKLKENDGEEVVDHKRKVQRSKQLLPPFVGNSTMKRLIPEHVIDPLSVVEGYKLKNLLDFIKENEGTPIGRNRGQKYLRLMTPKKSWPKKDPGYGWLHDGHMEDIMRMFSLRSISKDSPYCSQRIAFLDPSFVKRWVNDLKQFEMGPKNFNFNAGYIDAFNGTYDGYAQTNLKWFIDVDNLYITHHIRPDHWAALDINLKEERIDVYDSIDSMTSNNEVLLSCRPFARMIPHLLNKLVPPKIRKKKVAMFAVKRVKDIPQNKDVGDCGVYTVKYIERLALGENFDDLLDENMAAFRLQLACDTFHELPAPEVRSSSSIPSLIDEDLELLDDNPFE